LLEVKYLLFTLLTVQVTLCIFTIRRYNLCNSWS